MRSAQLSERLEYIRVLLDLMEDRSDIERRALTGGIGMWIGAIDETLSEENPDVGGVSYKTRRSQEDGGQTIIGLRLARNEIAHGKALVAATGAVVPFKIPLELKHIFIPTTALDSYYFGRSEKNLKAHDLALYERFVAEQDPETVLRRAYDWLVAITSTV